MFSGDFDAGEDMLLRAGLVWRAVDLNMAMVRAGSGAERGCLSHAAQWSGRSPARDALSIRVPARVAVQWP